MQLKVKFGIGLRSDEDMQLGMTSAEIRLTIRSSIGLRITLDIGLKIRRKMIDFGLA